MYTLCWVVLWSFMLLDGWSCVKKDSAKRRPSAE